MSVSSYLLAAAPRQLVHTDAGTIAWRSLCAICRRPVVYSTRPSEVAHDGPVCCGLACAAIFAEALS